MLAGGDIAFIVGKLQAPLRPLGSDWSRARGDAPERLLQLVSDAFACVAPVVGTRDVSSEDPDRTARRLVDFLRHVKYPAASDDPATVARWRDADVDVVPRAPLGPRAPGSLREARARRPLHGGRRRGVRLGPRRPRTPRAVHDLQRRFVEAHKEMEATRASSRDPARLRDRVARLEEEREQLTSRVARTDDKIAAKIGDKATVASLTLPSPPISAASPTSRRNSADNSRRSATAATAPSGAAVAVAFGWRTSRLRERGIALRAPRATRRGGGPRARRRDGDAPRRINRAPRTPRGDSRGDGRPTSSPPTRGDGDGVLCRESAARRELARANSRRRSRSVARFETATRSCVNRRRWQTVASKRDAAIARRDAC